MSEAEDDNTSVKRRQGGQFAPGQSGNRRGTPRKAEGLHDVLRQSMGEMIAVNIGAKRKKISTLEAAATQLANKSASCDPRATKMALDLLAKGEDRPAQTVSAAVLAGSDLEIITRFLERVSKIKHDTESSNEGSDHVS